VLLNIVHNSGIIKFNKTWKNW